MTTFNLHDSASTSSLSEPSSRESMNARVLDDATTNRLREALQPARSPSQDALSQAARRGSGVDEVHALAATALEREREREPQSSAVRVVVRFRPPMNTLEDPRDSRTALRSRRGDDCSGFVVDTENNVVESHDLAHWFTFDRAFDQNLTQEECYDDVGKPIVNDVLQGYHGTILAYGQTGSGKTYCMFGTPTPHDKQGLVPRAAQQVFDHVGEGCKAGVNFFIECSFFEVYCEQMRDLLKPGTARLQIKELPQKGFCVDGLTHKAVSSSNEVLQVIRQGLKQRAAGITRLNQHSSRSHAICTLHVQQREDGGTEKHGKLTLVDLAGSEKVHKSGSAGDMLEEAKKINLSLSTLGHVIDALADRRPHVPYRDSRLTRILEDSLGGNCRTTLLVTCSPNSAHSIETLSSLRFAARAKRVCNHVRVNVIHAADRQLFNRITQLRRELAKAHRELEQRFDGRKENNAGSRRPSASSPGNRHRPLLKAWNEDGACRTAADEEIPHGLIRTPRRGSASSLGLDKSASASSLGSGALQSAPRMPILTESKAVITPTRQVSGASRIDNSGGKAVDEAKLLSPPAFSRRTAASPEHTPMSPSPYRSVSDAASTAAASATSSAAVLLGTPSATPLSSSWDIRDMIDGAERRRFTSSDLGDDDLLIAHRSQSARTLPSCGGEVGSACRIMSLDDDDDENFGDVHSQDLQWKLELERHRCAILALELRNRTQESKDLRRQLEEAQVYRQFQPLLVTLGIPCLPAQPAPLGGGFSTVASVPVLPTMASMPVQELHPCDVPTAGSSLHVSASTSQLSRPSGFDSPPRSLRVSASSQYLGSSISTCAPSQTSPRCVRYTTPMRSATPNTNLRAATPIRRQTSGKTIQQATWVSPRSSSANRSSLRRSGSLQAPLIAATPVPVLVRSGSVTARDAAGSLLAPIGLQQGVSRGGSLSARGPQPSCLSGPMLSKAPPAAAPQPPCATMQPPVPMVPGGAGETSLADLRSELQRWVNSVSSGPS